MNNLIPALLLCSALQLSSLAQVVPGQPFPHGSGFPGSQNAPAEDLPKFDIDFRGGTPGQLTEMIQASLDALGEKHHINVIIPEEFKDEKLPALKMRNVDVRQLFKALESATLRRVNSVRAVDGRVNPQAYTMYGFQTVPPVTPRSIWYFIVDKPPQVDLGKTVRYFQLAPYLTEFTMDDIGSAIEAGWNMLGEKDTPKLNFHQDTKLLIAVGAPGHLEMISSMLKELGAGMTNRPAIKAEKWPPLKTIQSEPQPTPKTN